MQHPDSTVKNTGVIILINAKGSQIKKIPLKMSGYPFDCKMIQLLIFLILVRSGLVALFFEFFDFAIKDALPE